jgi:hypothetical protein
LLLLLLLLLLLFAHLVSLQLVTLEALQVGASLGQLRLHCGGLGARPKLCLPLNPRLVPACRRANRPRLPPS